MRIIIDTELNRIIVPDSFYSNIEKMNKVLEESGTDKKIDFVEYVKNAFEKAIKESMVRKDDPEAKHAARKGKK